MNDFKNVWERILENSNKIELTTKTDRRLKYRIEGNLIIWIPLEETMKKLYNQNKSTFSKCIEARRENLRPSDYPGTAQSYKWALLNHEAIWIEE